LLNRSSSVSKTLAMEFPCWIDEVIGVEKRWPSLAGSGGSVTPFVR
jgi:hypothetical protein